MSYKLKSDVAKDIKKKFRGVYLANTLGRTQAYMSLLLNQKINCPKTTAYAFTKMIDSDLEIDDLFERV